MFERILVPLDGSVRAEQAIPVAARLARAAGGTLIIVDVANIQYGAFVTYAPVPQDVVDRQYADTLTYLNAVASRGDLVGITTEVDVLSGPVAETLLAAVQVHRADLIVLSSHGRTGFTRWALGSIAQKVAQHAPVPVLVLRPSAEGGGPPIRAGDAAHPLSVLVPLDGSPLAEAAVRPAVELLAGLAGSAQVGVIHFLQVVDVPTPRDEPGPFPPAPGAGSLDRSSEQRDAARAYLTTVARRLREAVPPNRQLTITIAVACHVDAAAAIIGVASGRGDAQQEAMLPPSDVIALATHGRGGLARWAVGSVTERVLAGTPLPLLIVRPAEILVHQQAPSGEAREPSPLRRTAPLFPPGRHTHTAGTRRDALTTRMIGLHRPS